MSNGILNEEAARSLLRTLESAHIKPYPEEEKLKVETFIREYINKKDGDRHESVTLFVR